MQWMFPCTQNWKDDVCARCLVQSEAAFWWLLSISHVPIQAATASEGLQQAHWHTANEREQGFFLFFFINIRGSKFNYGIFMHTWFQLSLLHCSSHLPQPACTVCPQSSSVLLSVFLLRVFGNSHFPSFKPLFLFSWSPFWFPDLHPPSVYHSSLPINLDKHLSCLDFLASVNRTAISMSEPVSLWCDLESSSGYIDGRVLDAD